MVPTDARTRKGLRPRHAPSLAREKATLVAGAHALMARPRLRAPAHAPMAAHGRARPRGAGHLARTPAYAALC